MMRGIASLVLVGAAVFGQIAVVPPEHVAPPVITGRLSDHSGAPLLQLWGTPRERGFAQGFLLGPTIVADYDSDVRALVGRERLGEVEDRLVKLVIPRFRFSVEEEAELAGMLEGLEARLPNAEDRHLQVFGRTIQLTDLKVLNTVGDWMALGCSTFAFRSSSVGQGAPVAGRNFDFGGFRSVLEDQLVVARAPHGSSRGCVGVAHPGAVGLITAMNDAGVFVSIHDVPVRANMLTALRGNVPRLCALRRLMENLGEVGTLDGAHALLRKWPTLYGNNFMVVTPGPQDAATDEAFAAVFEYDNRREIQRGVHCRTVDHEGASFEPWLVCTNHHRTRDAHDKEPGDRCRRYNRLLAAVKKSQPIPESSVVELFATLSVAAFPEGRAPQRSLRHGTTHQVVGLTGPREFYVRLGKPGFHITEISPVLFSLDQVLAQCREISELPGASGR